MASAEDKPWSKKLLGTIVYDHFKRDIDADPLEPIELIIFESKKVTIHVTQSLVLELTGDYTTQFIRVIVKENGQVKADEILSRSHFRLPYFTPEQYKRR